MTSRRQVLKTVGAGAAAAWTAPLVLGTAQASAGVSPVEGEPTSGVVIPFSAAGWEYKQVGRGAEPSFPTVPLSGGAPGEGPFGDLATPDCFGAAPNTIVDGDQFDLLLERVVHVVGPTQVEFLLRSDDGLDVFIDGARVGGDYPSNHACLEYSAGPPTVLATGSYRISARGNENGGGAYFDLQMTATPVT